MAHVGEESGLHLVGATQVVGLLVQLRVERHHAAVGVLQLAVEPAQLLLAGTQLFQRPQQLLVLLLDLLDGRARTLPGQGGDELVHPLLGDGRNVTRQDLGQRDDRSLTRSRRDDEVVHQATSAQDADPHPGR